MSTGNSDSLHQQRVRMTEWEHRLRPKPNRHWALWLVLAVLLVFVAYRAGEWLLAQRGVAPPAQPPAAAQLPDASPAPDVRKPPDTAAAPAPLESYGVTKCVSTSGRVEYSDGPCLRGSHAATVWVQPDVNLADGMSDEARAASARSNAVIAGQVQEHEQRVARNVDNPPQECADLDERIKWLDAMARRPQGAATQDWLTNERKLARNRQFRLHCQ